MAITCQTAGSRRTSRANERHRGSDSLKTPLRGMYKLNKFFVRAMKTHVDDAITREVNRSTTT